MNEPSGLWFIGTIFKIAAVLVLFVFGLIAKWAWNGTVRRK